MRIFLALAFLVLVAGCDTVSTANSGQGAPTAARGEMATGSRLGH